MAGEVPPFSGWDIIYKAIRNICHGQVFDENFLMCIATFGALGVGEYSEAVAVMLFYQVGELFQSYAVGKSRQSISEMMDICPEYANIEQEGQLALVDPDDVGIGDVIVIKAGERIPLDGIVLSGNSFIDTSALTGESVPREVREGSEIISGCVNGSGLLKVQVTKEFDDSTVSKILELVENASSKKAKVENCEILYTCGSMCRSAAGDTSYPSVRTAVYRMAEAGLHFSGYFLPVCTCNLRAARILRRDRRCLQTGRAGQRKQLSGNPV